MLNMLNMPAGAMPIAAKRITPQILLITLGGYKVTLAVCFTVKVLLQSGFVPLIREASCSKGRKPLQLQVLSLSS